LQEQARQAPNCKLILHEEEAWSYKQVHTWANKCARAFRKAGLSPGDKVDSTLKV